LNQWSARYLHLPSWDGWCRPKRSVNRSRVRSGEVDQTRTWNLKLDVIAQSGKYAPGETELRKFVLGGKQRYWVHVAIDRFTGQVVDKQIEVVNE